MDRQRAHERERESDRDPPFTGPTGPNNQTRDRGDTHTSESHAERAEKRKKHFGLESET